MIKIYVTRGSVSASDDVDAPHSKELEISETSSVKEILVEVYKLYPLPKVYGGKATWSIISRIPLAVVAQQWNYLKLLNETPSIEKSELHISNEVIQIHFNYHAQIEPDTVFEVLERLRIA